MNWRWRNISLFVLATWAVWHVVATLVYTAHWPATGVLASASYRYMVPLFHQNWSLFAPNIPEYDAQLTYRASANDSIVQWSDWADVSASAGYGDFSKMEVIEQNFLVQLNYQLYSNYYSVNGIPQLDAMVKTPAYNKALYFAGRMHQQRSGNWRELQIAVVFRFPQRGSPIEGAATDTLFFPEFHQSDIRK